MKEVPHTVEPLEREVVIETYRSRGPGGQRKNKTETAVRLTHLPSKIVVIATERRSQSQNRKLAFERLRDRLLRLHRQKRRRIPTQVSRAAVERRIETKKTHSRKKALRMKPEPESGE